MELLRQTALSAYNQYESFDETGGMAELKIVKILAECGIPDTATYETEDIHEANILSRVNSLTEASFKLREKLEHYEGIAAELLLVSMWTSRSGNASEGIGISKACFLGLIDALDIDRCVLQPIISNMFGFVEYSETTPRSPGESNISTYYLANTWYQLMWSYNFTTSKTKAILITRRGHPDPQTQNYSRRVVVDFLASLRQQRGNIFNPYTLLFISLVKMSMRGYKSHKAGELNNSAGVFENKTKCGTYGDTDYLAPKQNDDSISSRSTHDALSETVKRIETSTASLANDKRQMDIIDSLLDALSGPSPSGAPMLGRRLELYKRDLDVFSAALRPLRQQNAASRSALRYMAARTRGQEQTVSISFLLSCHPGLLLPFSLSLSLSPFLFPSLSSEEVRRALPQRRERREKGGKGEKGKAQNPTSNEPPRS
ncbi:hypothetical protein F5Y09DRAFT_301773 [Xylaria sp. FL1042]|nr:hypothetical protein F5Y09DRAFT_301773 [Xylaria sp. FL1042]